ncbi:hypothetical protein NQ318_013867 [Aromia moschata]|uniref:Adenylate kinase n=1 Tax=Aromia moschata TaxID=1265417 RepID=A0AAV8Z8V8_9CUCU|nr:hypothetical protein NQ318_013867 [Aromia moschata]
MAGRVFKCVILGAPASGKGTISARIVNHFDIVHISSGDKLRQNIENRTPIGFEAQQYIQAGKLVPDETMIKFITGEIKKVGNKAWLLDGFPRTLSQAVALWDLERLNLAMNLIVPYKIIVDRGKDDVTGEPLIQREDDKPDIVMKRLEQYEEMTVPVIEFYRDKRILRDLNGEESEKLWQHVSEELALHVPSKSVRKT